MDPWELREKLLEASAVQCLPQVSAVCDQQRKLAMFPGSF